MNPFVLTGDTIFKSGTGRTDLPGGNSRTMVKSLKKLKEMLKTELIIPGHGEETNATNETFSLM